MLDLGILGVLLFVLYHCYFELYKSRHEPIGVRGFLSFGKAFFPNGVGFKRASQVVPKIVAEVCQGRCPPSVFDNSLTVLNTNLQNTLVKVVAHLIFAVFSNEFGHFLHPDAPMAPDASSGLPGASQMPPRCLPDASQMPLRCHRLWIPMDSYGFLWIPVDS